MLRDYLMLTVEAWNGVKLYSEVEWRVERRRRVELECRGVERSPIEWSNTEWSGVERSHGVEWSGVKRS